ncbi:calbindin 2a [Xyrichtys novacula]|uniref:Calbindin 2a n=1 Tax=Xyrichtys novacula TaxID=13765 RepID=A0AAV1F853_XYRNO|nr:calbindin 2a [Xyrichtys novacula]
MANKPQQPPHLHLAEVTASQFLDIWKHFDTDGNGYIEGKELENFFRELEMARRGAGVDPSNPTFRENMKEFMQKFDKNKDGRIEMSELAQILPTEENFLLCFRQFVSSSAEFMAAWRRYDTDRSGYIEANELKGFLSDLLQKANRHYDDQKLQEYTQTILRMFDLNGDGKLGLSEMARVSSWMLSSSMPSSHIMTRMETATLMNMSWTRSYETSTRKTRWMWTQRT